MNLPLLVAAASFASVLAVFLVGMTLIVNSSNGVSFARSVDAPLPTRDAGRKTVPISFDGRTLGTTQAATLKLARGGQAQVVTSAISDAGQVGYRPTTRGAR